MVLVLVHEQLSAVRRSISSSRSNENTQQEGLQGYIGVCRRYIGILENKMETTIL